MKFNHELIVLLALPLLSAAQSNNLGRARLARQPAPTDPVDHAYRYRQLINVPDILGLENQNSTTAAGPSGSGSSSSSTSTTSTSSTSSQSSISGSGSLSGSASATNSSSSTSTTTTTPSTTSHSDQMTTYTNSAGSIVVLTSFVVYSGPAASPTNSAANSTASDAPAGSTDDNSSISQSTIIGLSVAGGVAVIGIIAFIIWKFTRKRFNGLDDFEDGIKWPEYKSNGEDEMTMGPLPTRSTGGAGVETSAYAPSEVDFDGASVAGASTTELVPPVSYAAAPYSQPLPAQPYFDDPSGYNPGGPAYYDPYRGGVPPSMAYGAGRTSPGPQRSLTLGSDLGGQVGPGDIYRTPTRGMSGNSLRDATTTPPQRGASMGTPGAMGDDAGSMYTTARSRSPGPNVVMGGSPGEMGERRASPGPNLGLANP